MMRLLFSNALYTIRDRTKKSAQPVDRVNLYSTIR
jgi:hypothetical protein